MEPFDESAPPSKSALKRQMTELQKLGETLVSLPKDKLDRLPLPDTLRAAIDEARRIHAHGGLRRQMQYIGRLMREFDAQPVADQLQRWQARHNEDNAHFHQLEHWRDRLIADDASLAQFIEHYPLTDLQPLRTLIRNARKEAAQQLPPRSSRALFKLLRQIAAPAATGEPADATGEPADDTGA